MDYEEIGMQRLQREHILKNKYKLIACTKYEELISSCVKYNLLSEVMRSGIEKMNPKLHKLPRSELEREYHKELLLKITKRGPDAYQSFISICEKLNYKEAVSILNEINNKDDKHISISHNKRNMPPMMQNDEPPERENQENLNNLNHANIKDQIVNLKVEKSRNLNVNTKVGTYPMKSKDNRGVLFMVNLINFKDENRRRNGSEVDEESMKHLFSEFKFKIFSYRDITQEELFDELNEKLKYEVTPKTECFVLALMTHGNRNGEKDYAEFPDGSVVEIEKIQNMFRHDVCPNLKNKPKILIFPFCRGKNVDLDNVTQNTEESMVSPTKEQPTDGVGVLPSNESSISDTIICYATIPGYSAHRDPLMGNWYIQIFCRLMRKHAHDTHFDDILKMVQTETNKQRGEHGCLQTCSFINMGFNKFLYFNPGYFEE